MKKYLLAVLALAYFSVMAHAVQQNDGYQEMGSWGMLSNGVRYFTIGSQNALDNSWRLFQTSSTANGVPSYSLVVSTNGNVGVNGDAGSQNWSPRSGFDIGVGNGGYFALALSTYTSTQIKTIAPKRAGELIYDASSNQLCIATGTTAGAWQGMMSSGTAVSAQSKCE